MINRLINSQKQFWQIFVRWIDDHNSIYRIKYHLKEFGYVWYGLFALLFIALLLVPSNWVLSTQLFGISIAIITLLILIVPMNAVYGLMGTSGSIRLFFFNFIVMTALFTCIYYYGFFNNAGISYDVNQPHIDYNLYANNNSEQEANIIHKDTIITYSDTVYYKKKCDSEWVTEIIVQESKYNYQPIGFMYIWRNTILTTLMQEPTDFFSVASTYNESMVNPTLPISKQKREINLDKQKAYIFQWILIFQILISWIFFGVFISLLYNKFRYES